MKYSEMIKEFMFAKKVGSVVLAAVFLSACSGDSSEQAAAVEEPAQNSVFNFSHNYDGAAAVGEQETIKLDISEQYEAGVISVTVRGNDSLVFSSLPAQSFELADANSIVMDLVFTPEAAGEQNLNVVVDIDDGTGERSQEVFDIALNVLP